MNSFLIAGVIFIVIQSMIYNCSNFQAGFHSGTLLLSEAQSTNSASQKSKYTSFLIK